MIHEVMPQWEHASGLARAQAFYSALAVARIFQYCDGRPATGYLAR
jgi:hypothetical protein